MSPLRRHRGIASRFFLAQVLVVGVSILASGVVASLAGPPIFHEHMLIAGHPENSPELLHVERAYRDTNLITLGVALGTALICALVVSAWCSRRLRDPLERLTEAAQGMARGRYDTRVPDMGAGAEVDALASSFNTMAARLQRTEDTRRRMLSDLAHEMRTPISVLTVYFEALQDGVTHWDETTDELMSEQLARLTRLVEDINDVSRAEEGRMDLDRAEHPVCELVHAAVEAHREAYAAKGVELLVDLDQGGTVEVDRQRMGQVLGNLLTNALRHTPPGGTVTVRTTTSSPHHLAIQVADTGDGIAAEHLPQVFERFWRGDTARDRDHGGSGIGLTISKALVEAHGGALTATSSGPGHGAVFTVELPTRQQVGPPAAEVPG
ncbi:two-component sensor histidine kinase [Kocuria dechangensis]|uniref:histidine kinase n=1 Tax=Kocuria dechangensis TaxID=1176249 RepID=A0A917LWQ5_9MICC|nr:HAMP domain-containing sensor histidine kinase [Kocuria dechangensis]GGG62112.1 two-component sensor histidine kinase [Kocuria dechangensis]